MTQLADNPGQGNRGGQEYGEDSYHKSGRNQDSQRHETTPEEENLKKEQQEEQERKDDNEKFSPGQADNYDPEEYNTD